MPGNRILELQQQRNAVATKAADLLKAAADQKRALNTEETTQYDAIMADLNQIRGTLDRETQQSEIEASIRGSREEAIEADRRAAAAAGTTPTAADERRAAFVDYVRGGPSSMPAERRALLVPGSLYSSNFAMEHRAIPQSELTGNVGGYLVPTGFYAQVQNALKYYGGMNDAGARTISTSMGNDLPMPTANDTTISAVELGESSPAQVQEVSFGQVIFKAFKYTSQLILIPIELLQDSGVDIEAFIQQIIVTRFGRTRNNRFTVGDGTNKPRGIVLDAVMGQTGVNGQGAGLIYGDIVDLKYSVNRAYRRNAKWMLNDNTLKVILKLVDDNHRPLILDYLNALQAGEPEQILGQQLINNDDMPDLGTTGSPAVGNKSILYGDFSNYWIREVQQMLMMRLVERYAEYGQVAFLAFMRFDGRTVDAGTHPVKAYVSPTS